VSRTRPSGQRGPNDFTITSSIFVIANNIILPSNNSSVKQLAIDSQRLIQLTRGQHTFMHFLKFDSENATLGSTAISIHITTHLHTHTHTHLHTHTQHFNTIYDFIKETVGNNTIKMVAQK